MSASMTVVDHLFALVLCLGFTTYAVLSFRSVRQALERNEPGARLREYRQTMVAEWVLAAAALGLWFWADRGLAVLGLGLPTDWRHAVAAIAGILVAAGLALQTRAIAGSADARRSVAGQLGEFGIFLPHSRHELRWFVALSLTAGVCEELLYRGYLIWYLEQFAGPIVAVVVSSVVFGLAHAGYGTKTGVKAGLLGLVFAGLYLFSGALWVPMLVHVAIDVGAGTTGWLVLGGASRPDEPAAAAGRAVPSSEA